MYNREESFPSIRKYILKYIIQLDGVLADLKQARYIILGVRPHFYKNKIIIIGYYYNKKE